MKNNAAMEDHWSNNPQAFPNDVKPITDRAGMTGWRKRQVLEMAREAGGGPTPPDFLIPVFERFAELVRADEAEKYKWDVHSCGPTCTKVGCVAVRKAVEAERDRFLAALRQLHDSYSLASDTSKLKEKNT